MKRWFMACKRCPKESVFWSNSFTCPWPSRHNKLPFMCQCQARLWGCGAGACFILTLLHVHTHHKGLAVKTWKKKSHGLGSWREWDQPSPLSRLHVVSVSAGGGHGLITTRASSAAFLLVSLGGVYPCSTQHLSSFPTKRQCGVRSTSPSACSRWSLWPKNSPSVGVNFILIRFYLYGVEVVHLAVLHVEGSLLILLMFIFCIMSELDFTFGRGNFIEIN